MKGDRIREKCVNYIAWIVGHIDNPTDKEAKILTECMSFIGYVQSFGNQCAWTDRCCENIVELGLGLKLGNLTDEGKRLDKCFDKAYQERFNIMVSKLSNAI